MGHTLQARVKRGMNAGGVKRPLKLVLLSATAVVSVPFLANAADITTDVVVGAGGSSGFAGSQTIGTSAGNGSVTVEAGGTLASTDLTLGSDTGSKGTVTVTGTGSSWTLSGQITVGADGTGIFNITDGGTVSANGFVISAFGTGTTTVSGDGSKLQVSSMTLGQFSGGDGKGTLTISDGGAVRVGSGSGTINLASDGGTTGVLNIGAAEGSTAVAAGTLEVGTIAFQRGWGEIVFNHTDTDYVFDVDVTKSSGSGHIKHLSGTTTLTGNVAVSSSGIENGPTDVTSPVAVEGGTLRVANGGTLKVYTDNLNVGSESGSDGTLIVTGTGSAVDLWEYGGNVGYYGKGTVIVSDSGKVAGDYIDIAWNSGSTGTVTVTGANSLWEATSTTIGSEGSGSITVTNGGTVKMDGGTGTLKIADKSGSTGVLNIGAAAGETAAASGTLDAKTVDFGAGTGTIVFNHTDTNYEFSADVKDAGTLAFYSGTTKLTGDYSAFTGTAEIRGGTLDLTSNFTNAIGIYNGGLLSVNSTVANAITVYSGGTLGGSGTVSAVTLASGGKVAPGNSIGTLNVSGNLSFGSGSTYEVEVDKDGNSDKIAATGTVTIDSGAKLSVIAENGSDDGSTYNTSTDYTILSAGSLSGKFGTVSENFAYLDASVAYSGTGATLTLTRTQTDDGSDDSDPDSAPVSFASKVTTPNRKGTANAVESLGSGNSLYAAVEALPEGEPEKAFQQLSGENHSTMQGTFMVGAGMNRSTINQRLLNAGGGVGSNSFGDQVSMGFHGEGEVALLSQLNAQAWGRTYGGWSKTEATSTNAGVTSYGGGFQMGFDAELVAGIRTGVMAGYSRSLFDSPSNNSSGSADSYHVGAYTGTAFDLSGGTLGLRAGTSYTLHDVDTARTVAFTGFSEHLTADYNASTAQAFAEIGYAVRLNAGAIEPFAGFAVVNQHTDGFTETGGSAALTSKSTDDLMGVTTLGLRGEAIVAEAEGIRTSILGSLAWRHAFGDIDPSSTMRFASGGDTFAVSGTPIDVDTALFEAGVSFEKNDTLGLALTYQGELGETSQDHVGRLSLLYRF